MFEAITKYSGLTNNLCLIWFFHKKVASLTILKMTPPIILIFIKVETFSVLTKHVSLQLTQCTYSEN